MMDTSIPRNFSRPHPTLQLRSVDQRPLVMKNMVLLLLLHLLLYAPSPSPEPLSQTASAVASCPSLCTSQSYLCVLGTSPLTQLTQCEIKAAQHSISAHHLREQDPISRIITIVLSIW